MNVRKIKKKDEKIKYLRKNMTKIFLPNKKNCSLKSKN